MEAVNSTHTAKGQAPEASHSIVGKLYYHLLIRIRLLDASKKNQRGHSAAFLLVSLGHVTVAIAANMENQRITPGNPPSGHIEPAVCGSIISCIILRPHPSVFLEVRIAECVQRDSEV